MTHSSAKLKTLRGAVLAVSLVGLLTYLAGCKDAPKPTSGSAGKKTSTEHDERCDSLIGNSLEMLQPDRLEITSSRKTAIDLLNQWLLSCGSPGKEEETAGLSEVPEGKLLSKEALQRATRPRFSSRDADHIRDALLCKATVQFAVQTAENDLQRVVQLFDYVVRNIQLAKADAERIPLTPYHILLFGEGTAQDRAWIFTELLRQLRIDSVILRPKAESAEADAQQVDRRWLVGVLLDGKIYLFDTRLGWPVPSTRDNGETPTPQQPATLSEAAADDAVLKGLDVDDKRPYPLRADDLKSLRVELPGHTGLWSERMERLQASLSGARSVVISDPLQGSRTGDGPIDRVVKFGKGKWQAADVALWPYPEQQLHGFANLDERQSDRLRLRELPFDAPVPLTVDPKTGKIVVKGNAMRTLLKKRIAHLLGHHKLAVKAYLSIRLGRQVARLRGVPDAIRFMHLRAAEDAFVWMGLCQFEQGTFDTAAGTFRDYLSSYPTGKWVGLARGLLGLSKAKQGKFAEAADALKAVPEDNPARDGYDLLIRRWQKQSGVESRESRD